MLANIALDHLDWQLDQAGRRFVRYADDFVVLCPSQADAKEARHLVEETLGTLGLQLSAEKTKITTYGKGYSFLGFWLSSRSRKMRLKSVQKFQDKVRELTARSRNLDTTLIAELNRVIQGTAQYFATYWSTGSKQFRLLDRWMRMRLRATKFKCKLVYR